MRTAFTALLAAASFSLATPALSQSAGTPGVVTGGSSNVTINGKPAARQGDTTIDSALIEGSSNVLINGKLVAVIGNRTGCGGAITSGSHGVFINGKPMARQDDQTSGCAR